MPLKIKNPKTLSLILSILGIFTIVILAQTLEPKLIKISDISKNMLDEYVKVHGQVQDIQKIQSQDYPNPIILIYVKDSNSSITIVWRQDIDLTPNQFIQIIGKVSDYKGVMQIEASKIKVLS